MDACTHHSTRCERAAREKLPFIPQTNSLPCTSCLFCMRLELFLLLCHMSSSWGPYRARTASSADPKSSLQTLTHLSLWSVYPREPRGSSQAFISGRRRFPQWSWCFAAGMAVLNTQLGARETKRHCPQQPLLLCFLSNQQFRFPSSSGDFSLLIYLFQH